MMSIWAPTSFPGGDLIKTRILKEVKAVSRKKQSPIGGSSLVKHKKPHKFRFKLAMKFLEILLSIAQIAEVIVSMFRRNGYCLAFLGITYNVVQMLAVMFAKV